MRFFIDSTKNGTDGKLIRSEVADLGATDVYGAIHAYNEAHPDRTARSSGVVLPGTPEDYLQRSYPRYQRDGHWVDETD